MRIALLPLCAVAIVTFALPLTAEAEHSHEVNLIALNSSGVHGTAFLYLESDTLRVRIEAFGLEPGQPHPQHIHGLSDDNGMPIDSLSPTLTDDTDRDGVVEVNEGAPKFGPILLSLTSPPGGALGDFPTAPDGTIMFDQTYELTEDLKATLLPLDLREIVLHGLTIPDGIGVGTDGEADGGGGYQAVLPVASGEIVAVPEPTTALLIGGGMLVALRHRRRA